MPADEPVTAAWDYRAFEARFRPLGVHVEATIDLEAFVRDEAYIRQYLIDCVEREIARHDRTRGHGRAWITRRPSPLGTVRLQATVPVHPFLRASDRSEFDYAD